MKRVGIVSCYFKNNYGSMLQAYATKKILDNNNIPNETVNIDSNIDFKKGKRKYYMTQVFNFNFIKSKFGMIKMKFDTKFNKTLAKNVSIRNQKYKEFRKEFNLSRSSNTYKDLVKLAEERYSDVLLGSDQLWLPVNVVADYYTLNWVPNNINKISYSTSFGVGNIPEKYNSLYEKYLKRINYLSVREKSGVDIIKNITNLDAELVCDPTILLTKEEWDEVTTKDRIIKDKYILCYFLGNNIEHRKFVERLKEKTGYKIVSLNHGDEYVKYSDIFCDIAPYDIGPKEWINLIKNSEIVCTDSFHGTAFSLIYNKLFFNFRRYSSNSKASTNSRLDSLLNIVEVGKERILTGLEDIDEVLKYKVDFEKVNKNLNQFRQDSKHWLLSVITWKDDNIKHVNITSKEDCCGCTGCANICPKGAITMQEDNEGFLYPVIDKEKCIDCGMCKKVCPVSNKEKNKKVKQIGYIFQYKDIDIRKESTSGGFYTAIAEYVIKNNGSVYGVGLNKNFVAKHERVTRVEDLCKFRNSKYVQSNPNDTFKQVKNDLYNKLLVVYSGTACQIEGLKKYLQNDYDNLITVDVICRSVPSPLLWKKYIEEKNKNKNIDKVYFREKKYGYKYSNLCMHSKNTIVYNNGVDTDPYLRAFFSNISSRPSCYNCKFKEQYHNADFTIWDCFDVDNYDESFNDDIGTTRVLVNTKKATEMFDELAKLHNTKQIETDKLVNNFHQMFNSIKYNSNRDDFFEDLNTEESNYVLNKYFPNKIKNKLEKYGRLFLIKSGGYSKIIKIGKKLRKRV